MPEDKFYTKGVYLYTQKKYKKAIENFDKVLQINPDFEMAWYYKGLTTVQLDNLEDALVYINKALELNSSLALAWIIKSEIFSYKGNYDEALRCCNEALKSNPDDSYQLLQMAFIHERFKNYDKALDIIENLKIDVTTEESNKIQRMKLVLENSSKYSKNYFIPIIESPTLHLIPPDHDIIYSTQMFVQFKALSEESFTISTRRHIYEFRDKFKGDLNLDVFMTPKGIAFIIPKIEIHEEYLRGRGGPQYLSWSKVSFFSKGRLLVDNFYDCSLVRAPYHESVETFKKRSNTFSGDIKKLRYEYTKMCLEMANSYMKNNEKDKALQYIEKGFQSNVYRSEFDLNDELMEIQSSIRREKDSIKRKLNEEIDMVLINYLKSNQGEAFTAPSLLKRLNEESENKEIIDYFKQDFEGILNRLVFGRKIKTNIHEGKTFYFF